jgi:hypothetical protein
MEPGSWFRKRWSFPERSETRIQAPSVGRNPDIPDPVATGISIRCLSFQTNGFTRDERFIGGTRFVGEAVVPGWHIHAEIAHRLLDPV